MARRSILNESGIAEIVKSLDKSNDRQELIHDAIIDFNPVLQSPIVYDIIDNAQDFMAIVAQTLVGVNEVAEKIYNAIVGNKMQEEENRREMIEVLSNIGGGSGGSGNTPIPPPLPANSNDEGIGGPVRAGISAGITQVIASRIAAMIPASVKGMFLPITAFFGRFLKFSKSLIKFAGPIGIAISVITSLIGAIQGGIAGYKEGGVEGAIKGALIGAVDGLIGTIVKGLADAAGWLLKAIGLTQIGNALGPAVKGIFDNIYNNIKGFIDIIVGIFTLDSDKVIGGIKTMITGGLSNLKIIGSLLMTMIKELGPLIFKGIKFVLWDLPNFITGMIKKLWDYLWSEEGQKAISDGIGKIGMFITDLSSKLLTELWPWLREKLVAGIDSLSVAVTNILGGIFNWMGETLNWESIKETVFAGVDFISNIIDSVRSFMGELIDSIVGFFSSRGEAISSAFGSLIDYRNSLYKKILASILPQRTDDTAWSDPMHWVSKAIPDSVYKFAGLPTESGSGLNDATGGVNPFEQKARARDAGYSSWDEYKNSGWKWKGSNLQALPSVAGAALNETTSALNNAPIIINQMGGNVTNTNTSQVNNNTSPFEPIMTGSGLGITSM